MLERKDISSELKKSFESLAYYHKVTVRDDQGEFKVKEVLDFFRELAEEKEGDPRAMELIEKSRNRLRRILAAESRLELDEAFCDRVFEAQIMLAKAFPIDKQDCISFDEISPASVNVIVHSSGHLIYRGNAQNHYNSSFGISGENLKHPATTEILSARELKSLRSQGIKHSLISMDGRDIYSYTYTQIAALILITFLAIIFFVPSLPLHLIYLFIFSGGLGWSMGWVNVMDTIISERRRISLIKAFANGVVAGMLINSLAAIFFFSLFNFLGISILSLVNSSNYLLMQRLIFLKELIQVISILVWSTINNESPIYTCKRIINYILAVPELIIDQTIGRLFTGLKNLIFSKPVQQLPDDPTRPRWLALEAPSQSVHVQLGISPKSAPHSERNSGLSLAVETKGDSKAEHKNERLAEEIGRFQQIVSAYTKLEWVDVGLQEKYRSEMNKLGDRAMGSCVGLSSEEDLLAQKIAFYSVLNLFKDKIITTKDYRCVQALESYLNLRVGTIRRGRDIPFSDFEELILQKNHPASALSA